MTKAEPIKALEPYDDDMEVVFVTRSGDLEDIVDVITDIDRHGEYHIEIL